MRCKNCGWENPDNLTRCEKCGTALSGGGAPYQAAPAAAPAQNFNKTVNEAVVFPDAAPAAPAAAAAAPTFHAPVQGGGSFCPKCGYPLRAGVHVCPNCHEVTTEAEVEQVPISKPAAPKAAPKQQVAAPVGGGTVNPWVQVAAGAHCSLEPVAQDGVETPAALELKGEKHELNRANLDPENQTITSKVQANLFFEDGQWYIEDKSAQQTTFIHADGKAALKEGDVILMGNRQFIFHAEN